MPETVTYDDLAACLNNTFEAAAGDGRRLPLRLSQVSARRATQRQELFSLFFRGPAEPLLPQHTYRLDHETMGSLDLFLVPVGRDQDGVEYEAAFNRLIGDEYGR
jgi:hypothetical protein